MTAQPASRAALRTLLSGGDRRSIAQSRRAQAMVEKNPSLVSELVELTAEDDWLVVLRALDLLEKLAHAHPEWVEPHKAVFVGPLADREQWEIRLQIVRALPLFAWSPAQMRRVERILTENAEHPQLFVRAWALDALATLSLRRPRLTAFVERQLQAFELSGRKALESRARNIRKRLASLPNASRGTH